MTKTIAVLVLVLSASVVRAGDFTPLTASQVPGLQYTTNINNKLNGVAAIQPQIVCKNQADLPSLVTKGQVYMCHGCAVTNPCIAGGADVLAVGTCSDGSATCTSPTGQWNCNQGIDWPVYQPYRRTLGGDTTLPTDGTPLTITPFSTTWATGGPSPAHVFHVTLDLSLLASITVNNSGDAHCAFQLLVNGAAQRVASIHTGAGIGSSDVSIHYDGYTAPADTLFKWQLVGQATNTDTCVLRHDVASFVSGALVGPASRLDFDIRPE